MTARNSQSAVRTFTRTVKGREATADRDITYHVEGDTLVITDGERVKRYPHFVAVRNGGVASMTRDMLVNRGSGRLTFAVHVVKLPEGMFDGCKAAVCLMSERKIAASHVKALAKFAETASAKGARKTNNASVNTGAAFRAAARVADCLGKIEDSDAREKATVRVTQFVNRSADKNAKVRAKNRDKRAAAALRRKATAQKRRLLAKSKAA